MTPIERAREAARDALIAESYKFSDPVQYYIRYEAGYRAEKTAQAEGRDAFDAAEKKFGEAGFNESYQYLSDAAVNGLLASLSAQGLVIVPNDLIKPFADIARLEDMHGSVFGHKDIKDDETITMTVGGIQLSHATLGDARRLQVAMISAYQGEAK